MDPAEKLYAFTWLVCVFSWAVCLHVAGVCLHLAGVCLLLGVACLHGLEPDLERTLHGKLWLLAPRMGSRAYVRCSGEPSGTKNGLQSLRFPLFRARDCIPGTSYATARP